MKSLKACARKSRSTELPGPLPMIFDEAMAILAWATCASLSRSTCSGGIFLLLTNFSIRFFHVVALWKIPPAMPPSSFSSVELVPWSTFSVRFFLGLSSLSSPPTAKQKMTATAAKSTTMLAAPPHCLVGTLPMIIISQITRHSKTAVERFSSMMRGTMKRPTIRM